MTNTAACFSQQILDWFDIYGRHDLPWQDNPDPYRVWVSEVMLQQTQVKTVIPYYLNFLNIFPSITALATAPLDTVLVHWAGLGYYSRARNLHAAALSIMQDHDGVFPEDYEAVLALPGIGPSTAGAILAQALHQQHAILDGNVKRVLARYHGIEGWPGKTQVSALLWEKARLHTPKKRVANYTQAIMDLGATLCVRSSPKCERCPLHEACVAYNTDAVALYPTKKPKKSLPVKAVKMLIVKDQQGAILLEKRPPVGIWGGLWSLPELALDESVIDICAERWALQCEQISLGKVMRHSFSHYHLDITPCWLVANDVISGINETANRAWCAQDQLQDYGVSAPVSLLLRQSFE